MFLKLFVSILIVTSAFILAIGQTPEAKQEKEKAAAARAFAFSFDGDGGYLGVQTAEVNKDNFAKYGLRDVRGVAVEKVIDDSPAAAAGIKEGDVIVRLNGEEITGTRKLTRLISEVAPDHQVRVTISRNGSEQDLNATVGKRPTPRFENDNFAFTVPGGMEKMELDKLREMPQLKDFPKGEMPRAFTVPGGEGRNFAWRVGEGRQIGVGVMPLGKQLAEHFGVEGGVMVDNVRENSPAAKAGLKAGDIITEIDGKPVKGQFDLVRGINDKKEGDVTLTIVRDHDRQTLTMTPERSKGGGFFFQNGDGDEGVTIAPGQMQLVQPATPSAPRVSPAPMAVPPPMAAPAPFTVVRPARVI
jgi:serine protease Do